MKSIFLLLLSLNANATWYGILCNEPNGKQVLYHAENDTKGMGEGVCWDERKDGELPANVVPGAMTMSVDAKGKKTISIDNAKKADIDAEAAIAASKRAQDAKEKADCAAIKEKFRSGTDTAQDQKILFKCVAADQLN